MTTFDYMYDTASKWYAICYYEFSAYQEKSEDEKTKNEQQWWFMKDSNPSKELEIGWCNLYHEFSSFLQEIFRVSSIKRMDEADEEKLKKLRTLQQKGYALKDRSANVPNKEEKKTVLSKVKRILGDDAKYIDEDMEEESSVGSNSKLL
jgi:hypothetical protein